MDKLKDVIFNGIDMGACVDCSAEKMRADSYFEAFMKALHSLHAEKIAHQETIEILDTMHTVFRKECDETEALTLELARVKELCRLALAGVDPMSLAADKLRAALSEEGKP